MHRNLTYRNSCRDKLSVADKGLPIKQLTGGERAHSREPASPLLAGAASMSHCHHEMTKSQRLWKCVAMNHDVMTSIMEEREFELLTSQTVPKLVKSKYFLFCKGNPPT